METTYISAQQAATILRKTQRRVNQLVAVGILSGQVIGNSNVISKASVLKLKAKQDSKNGNNKKR
jgi:hypothetical protein